MPLTEDRNTAHKGTEILVLGMGANQKVYAGGMAAANAAGFIQAAADAAGLKVVGMSEEQVDNTGGANGDKDVQLRRKKAFIFKNSATNAVTEAHIATDIYVEDDETVSSYGGVNSIVAGKCVGIVTAGVLVEIG